MKRALLCILLLASFAFSQDLPYTKHFPLVCKTMSILDQSKVKIGGGAQTFQIGCDMPDSTTDDLLILDVAFVQYRDLNATMETPSGWSGSDVTDVPSGIATYTRTGGFTGTVTINFTGNDVVAVCAVYTVSNQKSSSALTFGSSHVSGGFNHVFAALTTAPYANAVFVGAVTSPDSNTALDVTGGTELVSTGGGMTKLGIPPYVSGGTNPLSIAYTIASAAGESSTLTWSSRSAYNPTSKAANVIGIGMWIAPSQAPSAPVFTSPTTNQLFTVGREVEARYNAASDPNVSSSLLTYELEYTINGADWNALTTTGAGITSYGWDTTGKSPSTTVRLRARANNGTENGPWGYSSVFTLLADSPPGAPTVSPTGIVNQEEDLTVTVLFNDPGDLQLALEIQWSLFSTMASPSTTGTVTTEDEFYVFAAATDILATEGTVWYRARNQGLVDATDGTWSTIKTLQVTAPISAPNITFPTNAVPPVSGTVTATFTGTGHAKIKYVIDREGVPVYFSPDIFTGGNSFLIDFSFDNDTNYTLHLQRAASDGLWSLEDAETFLVHYDGPEKPTVTLTPIDEAGYVQILIENSDSIEGQYIFINGTQLDTPLLPANTVFNYAGATSGEELSVVVRAFVVTGTGGYTDSDAETTTQNLQSLFLYEPTKELTTANFVSAPIEILSDSNEPEVNADVAMVKLRKRTKQVAHAGRGVWSVLNYSVMTQVAQIAVANQLESWIENGTVINARDNFAHNVFGNITDLDVADFINHITTPLVITQNEYEETV